MISYGLTMQGKPDEVPKEVAVWLLERNARYPNIEFEIGCWEPHPSQAIERESTVKKYSRLYGVSGLGVVTVNFLYLKQSWMVRIIGGLNNKGEIAGTSTRGGRSLPRQLRAEIAGFPETKTEIVSKEQGWTLVGVPRDDTDALLEKPQEMISLPADSRWTSELSLKGEELNYLTEFAPLIENPETRDEAVRLFYQKDWTSLRRLKERE